VRWVESVEECPKVRRGGVVDAKEAVRLREGQKVVAGGLRIKVEVEQRKLRRGKLVGDKREVWL
jgi:hypothetical protein